MTLPGSTPAHLDPAFAQALLLHEQGRLADADERYRSILAADAGHVPALLQLGVLRLQQGRHGDAVELTREALRHDPNSAEAHSNLGAALHLLAREEEAVGAFETALALDPDRAEAYYGLGLALDALQRWDEAIACHERALAIDPDYAEASCGLGSALGAVNRHDRAVESYRRALDIDPDYVEALCGLGASYRALRRHDEAVAAYQRAIAIRPEHAEARNALGIALQAAGRHAEAIDQYRGAIAAAPDFGDAQHSLGIALEEIGRLEEAHAAFERAIATDPENLRYTFALVASRRVREEDAALAALRSREGRLDALGEDERVLLHFALGKALSDLGRDEESFRHLLSGNALKRRTTAYDEAATLGVLEEIGHVFTAELMQRCGGAGHPSRLPILIVGMPRSGSTLVEQIVASHPAVLGGGERTDFSAAMVDVGLDRAAAPFPRSAATLGGAELGRLGARYLDRLGAAVGPPGARPVERITDKMPANFCFVGLIHLALPNARIIHTRRDPVDTCLSCFSRLFSAEQPFAYDLGELGRYFRGYAALMEHWRGVVPAGVILDVHYEELVADFEPQARRIIAHCGLEWDARCLSFHQTERVVRTASVAQVRQPVYQSSVGRWRPDDETLRPLLDGLRGRPMC